MRLALTNLAWHPDDDAAIAALLQEHGIDAIDIAPTKWFPDIRNTRAEEIRQRRLWWADQGIAITGMQSLLYGTTGLNMFGDAATQQRMLDHLRAVCDIGAGLGATRLVFGSPANRQRNGLDEDHAQQIALEFFRRLGDIAQAAGVCICLEAVATHYRCDFMNTTASSIALARALDHPAISITLDTANLQMNGESIDSVLPAHAGLVGHIHASEKDLVPLGEGDVPHAALAAAMRQHLPADQLVCVEILPGSAEPQFIGIRKSLSVARCYHARIHHGGSD